MLHFDNYFEWPSLSNPIYGDGYCGGLDSHIAVLNDGRVVPCCLDYQGIIELGNLQTQSLDEILSSKEQKTYETVLRAAKPLKSYVKDAVTKAGLKKCNQIFHFVIF